MMSMNFRGRVCAHCTNRTEVWYEQFPRCPDCGERVCESCATVGVIGAVIDSDYDCYEWTRPCARCVQYDGSTDALAKFS